MFLFIHIGIVLVVTAYYALSSAVAPDLVEQGRACFARRPWRPILLGALISLPWLLISLAMANAAVALLKFVGVVLICIWVLLGLVGGAGIAQHIGHHGTNDTSPGQQTIRGGLIISLTWILPVVGWLGMLPLTLCAGIGCFTMAMWSRRQQPAQVAVAGEGS
jgi:uncharacterized membrane protein SpoIIM required for sporulation